jgi:hypothetical protein
MAQHTEHGAASRPEAETAGLTEVSIGEGVFIRELGGWRDFVDEASRFTETRDPAAVNYIFRGQSEDWPLRPALLRYADAYGLGAPTMIEVERQGLVNFQQTARVHLSGLPAPSPRNLYGWWMLMQHYRAPTRLLDWTASPFVAAYFAVQRSLRPHILVEQDKQPAGVVWAVQVDRLETALRAKSLFFDPETLGDADATMRRCWDHAAPSSLAVSRVPIQTDRMSAQQTLFTLSAQVMAAHGQIITDVVRDEKAEARIGTPTTAVIKYKIPAAAKDQFLHQLHAMNITAHSLFPGLDGLGDSVSELTRLKVSYEARNRVL